jgi:hypothetical protein
MNLYQCERKAQESGLEKPSFMAIGAGKLLNCRWLDPYMGLILIGDDATGFVTTKDLDEAFPELDCHPLWATE